MVNSDDIIRKFLDLHPDTPFDMMQYAIPLRIVKHLAEAIAKAACEECAKVCELADDDEFYFGRQYADAIRARGQQ